VKVQAEVVPLAGGGLVAIIALLLPLMLSGYWTSLLSLALIYAIAAMGQTVLTGTANQPSLGNSAFLLVGAYSFASFGSDLHMPFGLAVTCAIVLAVIIGLLVGLPTVRISGVYLAVATIALVFVCVELLNGWDAVLGRSGPTVVIPGWLAGERSLYYVTLLVAGLVTLLLWNLGRSRVGRTWRAMKLSEPAAVASGVRLTRYRLIAFAIVAGVTAAAGVLLSVYDTAVTPNSFDITVSLSLLSMAVIGGLGSLPGAYIGAFIVTLMPNILGALPTSIGSFYVHSATTLVSAVLLLLTLAFFPGGLWSLLSKLAEQVPRFRQRAA
jgi:branched-chain amino acid transport system permease protein